MHALILTCLLAQGAVLSPKDSVASQASPSKVQLQKAPEEKKKPAAAPEADDQEPLGLTAIRRVYVDKFGGGATADHLREMVISSLQNSRLFVVTENEDSADALLKGSADADTFKDLHITSENANLRNGGSRTTSMSVNGPYSTRETDSSSSNSGGGESSSSHIEERKHEASAAVRLVLKNGDVVWSTTQESLGAKFRGASADVADKITRQLMADWQRAKREKSASVE